jgi:CRISPR locus-related DNA-binding protein
MSRTVIYIVDSPTDHIIRSISEIGTSNIEYVVVIVAEIEGKLRGKLLEDSIKDLLDFINKINFKEKFKLYEIKINYIFDAIIYQISSILNEVLNTVNSEVIEIHSETNNKGVLLPLLYIVTILQLLGFNLKIYIYLDDNKAIEIKKIFDLRVFPTYNELIILKYLIKNSMTIKDLSNLLNLDNTTLSRRLKNLEVKGLVKSIRKNKEKHYTITEVGRIIYNVFNIKFIKNYK